MREGDSLSTELELELSHNNSRVNDTTDKRREREKPGKIKDKIL